MSHSCDPNIWWISDTQLAARCDIEPGEEITYDYSTSDVSPDWVAEWDCKCGAKDCRMRITSRDCLQEDFQRKYGENLPSWTKQFIESNKTKSQKLFKKRIV